MENYSVKFVSRKTRLVHVGVISAKDAQHAIEQAKDLLDDQDEKKNRDYSAMPYPH